MSRPITTSSPLFEQIEALGLAAERGELSAAEMEELDRLVRDDPQARRLYAQYIVETVDLHSWAACSDDGAVSSPPEISRENRSADVGRRAGVVVGFPTNFGFLDNAVHGTIGYFSQTGPLSYLIATFIMLLMGVVAGNWELPEYRQVARQSSSSSRHRPTLEPKMEFVGRITSMIDCQWADPHTAVVGPTAVPLGRKYALRSGLMEITCDSGAKVILQGPCTYEVEGRTGGFLTLGKLTARVESAKPQTANLQVSKSQIAKFVVRTPTAVVTDLGTEFAVQVAGDGSSETQVFVGSVRCQPIGSANGARTLTAGQIARVQSDSRNVALRDATEADGRRFIRTMPSSERTWRGDVYEELVANLNPVAYYRMEVPKEGASPGLITDSASGRHHGTLHTDHAFGQRYGGSRFGTALWFGGPGSGDYVIVPDCPKTETNQLSVSAWVYAVSRPIWASIAKNWGRMKHGQFFLGLTMDDGDLSVYVQDEKGKDVCAREGYGVAFPLERWQHVAFVADGRTLHLYRNGREVASTPAAGINPSPAAANLGIGAKLDDTGQKAVSSLSDCWHGWIDELAIFHRALTPEEIGQLAWRRGPVATNSQVPLTPNTLSGR